ncbi:MAG: hypothetical protein OEV87_12995 [Phycisphaerae bacterium]|nr:hypothetical protein [Phycisphaerae bacterium]
MNKPLVLAAFMFFCQLCMAVTITATDNLNGTCLIELSTVAGEENIVGMSLEVDSFGGDIVAVDITSYNPLMNIYPEYAYTEDLFGDGYQYGEGHPICLDNTPGAVPLPLDDFTISAGALSPGFDGYATVRFLLSANENVTGRIQENATRGGLIAMGGTDLDITPSQVNFTITIPEPASALLQIVGAGLLRVGKRKR